MPSFESAGTFISHDNEQQKSITVISQTPERLSKTQNKTSQNELKNIKKIIQNMKELHKSEKLKTE